MAVDLQYGHRIIIKFLVAERATSAKIYHVDCIESI